MVSFLRLQLPLLTRTLFFFTLKSALHELDPVFRKVTLENEQLKKLVRDLGFHRDPVGESLPCILDSIGKVVYS